MPGIDTECFAHLEIGCNLLPASSFNLSLSELQSRALLDRARPALPSTQTPQTSTPPVSVRSEASFLSTSSSCARCSSSSLPVCCPRVLKLEEYYHILATIVQPLFVVARRRCSAASVSCYRRRSSDVRRQRMARSHQRV